MKAFINHIVDSWRRFNLMGHYIRVTNIFEGIRYGRILAYFYYSKIYIGCRNYTLTFPISAEGRGGVKLVNTIALIM